SSVLLLELRLRPEHRQSRERDDQDQAGRPREEPARHRQVGAGDYPVGRGDPRPGRDGEEEPRGQRNRPPPHGSTRTLATCAGRPESSNVWLSNSNTPVWLARKTKRAGLPGSAVFSMS